MARRADGGAIRSDHAEREQRGAAEREGAVIDILLQSRRNQVVLDVAGQSLMFTSVRALGPTERAAKPAAFSGGGGRLVSQVSSACLTFADL